MNKLQISIFLLFFLFSLQSVAQEKVDIKRSDKTEIVNGEKYYIHTVQKGQTTYSLSKFYHVGLADIYKNNPGSENGLKLDQQLKIPFNVDAGVIKKEKKDSLSSDKDFIYHKVSKGETLYRITRKYNVNQNVLSIYNPNLTVNLRPGDIIKIPTQNKLISDKAKLLYPSLMDYKVKKRDTYYKLHRKLDVSQAQLEQLNPILKDQGLQKGLVITVPKGLKKLDTIPVYVEIVPDSVVVQFDSLSIDSASKFIVCDSIMARSDTFHIALMIPFYTDLEGVIRTSSAYYSKEASTYKSFRFIQFYEGFLMALDSIKALGFNAEVYIYDTKGDTAETRRITEKPEFQSLDLVIGPLFHANVKIVLEAGKVNNTKVVSPFSRDMELVETCSNLFKVMPNTQSIISSSCQWVSDSLPNSRIIVLHDGTKAELELVGLIKKSFEQHAGTGIDTNQVFFYSYKNSGSKKLLNKLTADRKNVLINLSNNEAKISNFVRDLNSKAEDNEIYLIGSELNWKRFETLEVKYLVNLHLTQCTQHFIDPLDTAAHQFELGFISKYKTVPNFVAYNGFDISWFFMNALYYYGVNFEQCMNKLDVHTMSTKYRFKQNGSGAYENSYLNLYQYNNYKLVNKKAL